MSRFVILCGLVVTLATAGWAQDQKITGDLARWDMLAAQAETAVDARTAGDAELVAFRESIVKFRADFDAARTLNADRIAILREQLAALGPVPEGESAEPEAPEVAAKREELNRQLSGLLAPVQRAEAAFLLANGLVGQIDTILRERQTNRLLTISPSPMNPSFWQPAVDDLTQAARSIWRAGGEGDTARSAQGMRDDLPAVIILSLLGLVLILRGRRWAAMIVGRLHRYGARGFFIWRFVVSLLRIVLPLIGLVALATAATISDIFGPSGNEIIALITQLGAMMLGFRWVSERVFSRDDDEALILLGQTDRKNARWFVGLITINIVLVVLLKRVLELDGAPEASRGVLLFPLQLLTCYALCRIGQILRGFVEPQPDVQAETEAARVSTLSRIISGLGLGAMAVAVICALMFALGYFDAADALLGPYVLTLILLGLVMVLQRFAADVYGALTGQGVQARDALIPVFFGVILLLLVAPLLALAWGARVTDLTEMWSAFGRGFAVGDSRISPTDFLTFAIIFILGYFLTRLIQGALRSNVLPKTKIDLGGQNAIVSGLGYVGIFLAALAAITGAGIDLSSLAIVAGALSVGIGFGLQNIVSNFVSGIILLIERPISEGDWIEVGGQMGYVRDISVRSTRIETFDKTDVIVPNADLVSGTVTNFTRGNTVGRLIVKVGVAYGTDTKRIDGILREIAADQPMVLANPAPNVLFLNFGADALEFEIRCFLRDVNWMMQVKSDINHAIAIRFVDERIEVPFAQRDLWLRNPEVLKEAKT